MTHAVLVHTEKAMKVRESVRGIWLLTQETTRKATIDRIISTMLFLLFLAAFIWSVKLYNGF